MVPEVTFQWGINGVIEGLEGLWGCWHHLHWRDGWISSHRSSLSTHLIDRNEESGCGNVDVPEEATLTNTSTKRKVTLEQFYYIERVKDKMLKLIQTSKEV